jgi:propanediol dehydratase small subunit
LRRVPDFDPVNDYPLAARRPDLVRTPSGLKLDELTLEALREGHVSSGDVRATPETLRRQALVSRAHGRGQLADNLDRAAELTAVPDDVVLAIYTALRPRRTTAEELTAWSDRLEVEFQAPRVAALVREARDAYAARGLLA